MSAIDWPKWVNHRSFGLNEGSPNGPWRTSAREGDTWVSAVADGNPAGAASAAIRAAKLVVGGMTYASCAAQEPQMGANVFSRHQTQRDPARLSVQVEGPGPTQSDRARHQKWLWTTTTRLPAADFGGPNMRPARQLGKRALDPERALLRVDVASAQRRQLTPAQTAEGRQEHQRPVPLRHHLDHGDNFTDRQNQPLR